MTPQEFKEKMELIASGEYKYGNRVVDANDNEAIHAIMDELLCELLRELGYGEGVEIFEKTDKWYA